jgi:hypothetical protein
LPLPAVPMSFGRSSRPPAQPTPEQVIAKAVTEYPEAYDRDVRPVRKDDDSLQARASQAIAHLARLKVGQGQTPDYAQAVAMVVAERPELYDASVSREGQ